MDIFIIRDILDQICNYLNPKEVLDLHLAFDLNMSIKWVEILMDRNRGVSKCYICYKDLNENMKDYCPCCKTVYCKKCFDEYRRYCSKLHVHTHSKRICYATLCFNCFDKDSCKSCFLNYIGVNKF